MNSPWMDRYEGQPHDIYLPLATSRINSKGEVVMPDHIGFLSIDNTLGEMPESCVIEPTPYIIKCFETAPDAPSPFVWVYPFHEYHAYGQDNMSKPFSEEWFIIAAINSGLPLSTVVSSDNFVDLRQQKPDFCQSSILVMPVPYKGTALNQTIIQFVQSGGQVMLYGALSDADPELLNLLNLYITTPLNESMTIDVAMNKDNLVHGSYPKMLCYSGELSDGGVDTIVADDNDSNTTVLASVNQDEQNRIILSSVKRPNWNGGCIVWCRGYACSRIESGCGTVFPVIDNGTDKAMYPLGRLFTQSTSQFGYEFRLNKQSPNNRHPVIMIHRNAGSCWFSGYTPDTTVEIELKTPIGAPLLLGYETVLHNGCSTYRMPRAWRQECRVFVKQNSDNVLACKERDPVSYLQRHKWLVTGLQDATVYVLPKNGKIEKLELLFNSQSPYVVGKPFTSSVVDTPYGKAICAEHITGSIQISDILLIDVPPMS